MSRSWKLDGPDEDILTLEQVARSFGYEVKNLQRLIREGRFPPPRGLAPNSYYTGLDVAVIRIMLGRWQPAAAPSNQHQKKTLDDESEENL